MGTAIVGLMILAGIAYFIRTWSFVVGSADYQEETLKPLSGQVDTEAPEIMPELTSEVNPKPKAPVVSSVTASNGQAFWLQVHSLQTKRKANLAAEDLNQMGYQTSQRMVTNPDGTSWYVVYIGPFADTEIAQEAAEALQKQEQITTVLRSFYSSGTR
jgi:cell division septation protein DedD